MNKGVITLLAVVCGTIGAYVPIFAGWDPTGLGGPSILGGLVGGLFGIWLAVKITA